jgi:hypothetical protein
MTKTKRLWLSLNAVRVLTVMDGMNHVRWTSITGQMRQRSLQLLVSILLGSGLYCQSFANVMSSVQTATDSVHTTGANIVVTDLGVMVITSYQPIPAQTKPECKDRYHCTTSIDDGITQYGTAVSQDLLRSGQIHYGDVLKIEGFSTLRVVNDTMNKRHKRHVDLMVFSYAEEHRVGTQHRRVWVIHSKGETQWNTNHTPQRSQHRADGQGSLNAIQPSDITVHSEPK